jgi:hypothetical protein
MLLYKMAPGGSLLYTACFTQHDPITGAKGPALYTFPLEAIEVLASTKCITTSLDLHLEFIAALAWRQLHCELWLDFCHTLGAGEPGQPERERQ